MNDLKSTFRIYYLHLFSPLAAVSVITLKIGRHIACVASVSVWFRSKERPRFWPREK